MIKITQNYIVNHYLKEKETKFKGKKSTNFLELHQPNIVSTRLAKPNLKQNETNKFSNKD